MDDLEEFRRQLRLDPEKARHFAEESRRLMHEVELRLRERPAPTIEEMRAYIDKVKKDIEEQRKYNTLPWWKRLFTNPPPRLAG